MASTLKQFYSDYLACLNAQNWAALGSFVADDVVHNEHRLGLSGYRDMLMGNFADIPDLVFHAGLVAADAPYIAARLDFDCRPKGTFLGLAVNGRRVRFAENVFYEITDGKIARVWSVIDKTAIAAALR